MIKTIFRFSDIDLARMAKNKLLKAYPDFQDASNIHLFNGGHSRLKKYKFTQTLKLRRPSTRKSYRVFPNMTSANRLISAVLIDLHEE